MNSYKILVVEDEKNICNFMKMIFETNDYQVIFAQNGKNGLTMFFSHNPDLVILDLGLPDMDGVDVIREIRAKNDTPIVVFNFFCGCPEYNKSAARRAGAGGDFQ